jgi:hypothetical protein
MAISTSPRLVTLDQVPQNRAKTPAERAKNYRARKKAANPGPAPAEHLIPLDFLPAAEETTHSEQSNCVIDSAPPPAPSPARMPAASIILTMAALALAGVGITMNGWFAESMGATPVAGYLFLAIGVAADMVALAVPSVSAYAWQARQRATALAGWTIWAVTFCFAITAGIGFASVNITDVTMARAARVTPGVTAAQTALADAMASRDRECAHGVGPFCRQREQAVSDRRQALDQAMASVAVTADPQSQAATRIVAWISGGLVRPTGDDFGMLRLLLLSLLPQLGGVLLMLGRHQGERQ